MIELHSGRYAARVNPHGGGLAALTYAGADIVRPQDGAGGPPQFRGAVLAPWSNRIGDGRYRFDGRDHLLTVSEPDRRNALHGLVLDSRWEPAEVSASAVTLGLRLGPAEGYPFRLNLRLGYSLSADGLAVALLATNAGESKAPYGCGFHPYVRPGGPVDDAVLGLAATERVLTDPERLLPVERVSVAGTDHDFSRAHPIGSLRLDDAFTGLVGDAQGRHRLLAGDIEVWWDAALPWVHLFTPPGRDAIAIEPCTSPPDAFRTGEDLVALAPDATHAVRWGLRRAEPTEDSLADD